jgi:hypothetical protein
MNIPRTKYTPDRTEDAEPISEHLTVEDSNTDTSIDPMVNMSFDNVFIAEF